jgi:putative redox protein
MALEHQTEVTVALIAGMAFQGAAGEHTVRLDASPAVGGEDSGLRPMDLLLIALAGCMAMDVISILRKKRQRITGYTVRVRGRRAGEHPDVFTAITMHHAITGAAVQPEAVARAIELSTTKYCPAYAMLSKSAPIESTYSVVVEDGG